MDRMKEADAFVFGSPVYIDNITGQMKIFFDRLADAIHYQHYSGKYGCSVATTAESGSTEVVAYLNHVLNYLGVVSVGGIGIATGGQLAKVEEYEPAARALGKKLVDAVREGYIDPVQDAILSDNRGYFKAIVEESKDLRADDYARWVRMGWIK
jgi:multimeric flavodoxin WrbA